MSCLNTASAKIMEKILVVVVYVISVPTVEESRLVVILPMPKAVPKA